MMPDTSKRLALAFCLLLLAPLANSQDEPSRPPVRLKPLVSNALERALPSPADFSARIWQGRSADYRFSRTDFERAYAKAREEYRRDALVQLQPISELFSQLNAIETIVWCAKDANDQLQELTQEALHPDPSWKNVNASWTTLAPKIACVSGELPQTPESSSQQASLHFREKQVRDSLDRVILRVRKSAADVVIAINAHAQVDLIYSVRILSRQLDLYYVVAAIQLSILSKDIHEFVPTMGPVTPESSEIIEKLQTILNAPISEK